MLKDIRMENQVITSKSAFLKELKSKLPDFFVGESFDMDKFKRSLAKESIQTELSSGYQLDFVGKNYAKKQTGELSETVVVPNIKHNEEMIHQNSRNLFFTGDNLEVLRHLQPGYENSIDVIYIDPPYNTGSDGFVYPDSFSHSDEKLKAMFGLDEEGLSRLKSIQGRATHSAWLTFMYPRLWLAKRLLKDTGVIFVSIDDNEQANLKLLMDEIFGEGQFVGTIIHQRAKGGGQAKYVVKGHDIVNVYSKNISKMKPLLKPKNIQSETITIDGVEYIKNDDIYRKTFGKYEKGTERRLFYEEALELKGQKFKDELDRKINAGEVFLEKRSDGNHIMYSLTPITEAFKNIFNYKSVI